MNLMQFAAFTSTESATLLLDEMMHLPRHLERRWLVMEMVMMLAMAIVTYLLTYFVREITAIEAKLSHGKNKFIPKNVLNDFLEGQIWPFHGRQFHLCHDTFWCIGNNIWLCECRYGECVSVCVSIEIHITNYS